MQFMELERVETGQRRIADFLAPSNAKEEIPDVLREEERPDNNRKRSRSPSLDYRKAESAEEIAKLGEDAGDEILPEDPTWLCPKCGTILRSDEDLEPDERFLSVLDMKRDHEDYHFALELQSATELSSRPTDGVRKIKKKRKKAGGIAAFFRPKT